MLCSDGSFVGRDPSDCSVFLPCPNNECGWDSELCEDGLYVSKDPTTGCTEFLDCMT